MIDIEVRKDEDSEKERYLVYHKGRPIACISESDVSGWGWVFNSPKDGTPCYQKADSYYQARRDCMRAYEKELTKTGREGQPKMNQKLKIIEVRKVTKNGDGRLVSLFSDPQGEEAMSNPFTVGNDDHVSFYADEDECQIKVTDTRKPGIEERLDHLEFRSQLQAENYASLSDMMESLINHALKAGRGGFWLSVSAAILSVLTLAAVAFGFAPMVGD